MARLKCLLASLNAANFIYFPGRSIDIKCLYNGQSYRLWKRKA